MHEILDWIWRLLAAELLFVLWGYSSWALSLRLLPTPGIALRWTAACVIATWLLSVGFHILLSLGSFTLLWATVLGAALFAAAIAAWGKEPLDCAYADLRRLRRIVAGADTRTRIATFAAAWAILAVAVRAALVPVVAWDSLTYHAVKAALWVQTGGAIDLVTAGGFNIYRNYPGGGEVLHAWAMLPMRSDVLAGCVDSLTWLGLGLAVHALGAQLDLTRTARSVAAVYMLAVPAVARAAGSLYVDNTLALSLVAACALIVHALHAPRRDTGGAVLLACMALGVGIGVKIFAIPVTAFGLLAWVITAAAKRSPLRLATELTTGAVAIGAAAMPWWVGTWSRTGYPLSPFPLRVGGITLGEASPAMLWYLDRPATLGTGLLDELQGLLKTFGVPGTTPLNEPTLGVVSLLVLAVAAVAWGRLALRDWRSALLTAAFVVPMVSSYYGEGLKNTRLIWASVSGRYLLALLGIALVVSMTCCRQRGRWQAAYGGVLAISAIAYLLASNLSGWTTQEIIAAWGLGFVGALAVVGVDAAGPRLRRGIALATALALLVAPLSVVGFREATRLHALQHSIALHASPRYWVPALEQADEPARPRTIAVTGGANQDSDNWLLYPLLGRRFQNRLIYVPVTADGVTMDLADNEARVAAADYTAWRGRLQQQGVDQVMSFTPQSLELFWMERDPGAFTRLAGDGRRWGLYQVGGNSAD